MESAQHWPCKTTPSCRDLHGVRIGVKNLSIRREAEWDSSPDGRGGTASKESCGTGSGTHARSSSLSRCNIKGDVYLGYGWVLS